MRTTRSLGIGLGRDFHALEEIEVLQAALGAIGQRAIVRHFEISNSRRMTQSRVRVLPRTLMRSM